VITDGLALDLAIKTCSPLRHCVLLYHRCQIGGFLLFLEPFLSSWQEGMFILRKRQYLNESQVGTLGGKYKSIPDQAPHSSVNLKSQIYKCLQSDYETSNIVSLLVVVTIFLSLPYLKKNYKKEASYEMEK
jgi:hypothetical protein